MREKRIIPYRSGNFLLDSAIILFLGIVGPFGLYDATPMAERFLYFVVTILIATVAIYALCAVMLRENWSRRLPGYVVIGISALCVLPLSGALIAAWGKALFDFPVTAGTFAMDMIRVGLSLAMIFPLHYAISMGQNGATHHSAQPTDPAGPAQDTADTGVSEPKLPRIYGRIPLSIGTDIVSLSAQDHYVDIVTTKGNELILSRLSDAIAELDNIEGIRIHRSHWVAREHAQALTRLDGRPALQLSDGRLLPVAQARLKAVKSFLA